MDVLGTILIGLVGLALTVWVALRAFFAEVDKAVGGKTTPRTPGEGKAVNTDPVGSGVPTDGSFGD